MNIKDALKLKPVQLQLSDGTPYTVRRPSAADLIQALEIHSKEPSKLMAWFVFNHLIEDGRPVFDSVDQVLESDAVVVEQIATSIEALYGEGRD